MPVVNINERSWGIDLISCINEFLIDKELVIKRAGGENSLKAPKNTMFPDVLLFGDSQSARVLQGWELKMPDTDIDDEEFINNAHTKAKILKLNSFLLWNVNYARLYMIGDEDSYSWVRKRIAAIGYSSSLPVLNSDGEIDLNSSRRVEIKIRTKSENVIFDINNL